MIRAGACVADEARRPTSSTGRAHDPVPPCHPHGCDACDVHPYALCAPLAADELRQLERHVTARHLGANATLVVEGDAVLRVYTVLRGMLRVVRHLPDGRRHVVEFLAPGDTLDFEPGRHHASTVEAVTDTELCGIDRASLATLGSRFPALQDRRFLLSCRMLGRAREHELSLGRRTPVERVAAFVLALAERGRLPGPGLRTVRLPMTRADIADHLGLTIETVSRSFTALRRRGVIALPSSRVVQVRDRDALAALAGREPAAHASPPPAG